MLLLVNYLVWRGVEVEVIVDRECAVKKTSVVHMLDERVVLRTRTGTIQAKYETAIYMYSV